MPDDIPPIDDLPLALRISPEQTAAARRAVLWRYDRGEVDATQARDALAALGLIPYEGSGRTSARYTERIA